MLYRHHKGARLALTSGHVTMVGTEWEPLHERFHAEALAQGCQCDQNIIPAPPVIVPKASPQGMVNTDSETVLRRALITMINRDSTADDFTNAGLPNLKVLRREAGMEIDKEAAYAVFRQLQAEAEAAAAAGNGDGEDASADADAGEAS